MPEHVVAVVAAVEEAEQRFSAWLSRRGLRFDELAADDVRVDAHQGFDGVTRMRFWVRSGLVAGGLPGSVRYFPWREIRAALAHAAAGGIAVHRNLDYSGRQIAGRHRPGPFLHILGLEEPLLAWAGQRGYRREWMQPARRGRPPHFDVFGEHALGILAELGVTG